MLYALRQPEEMTVDIKEGPLIEEKRQRALEEDPDADVSTITSVTLPLAGMRGMFPSETAADDFQIRTVAEEVGYFEIDVADGKLGIYRIVCTIAKPEDQDLKIVLFASESVLDGYRPRPGDNLEGIIWLQGCLVE